MVFLEFNYSIFDLNVFEEIAPYMNKLCGTKKRRKMIIKKNA